MITREQPTIRTEMIYDRKHNTSASWPSNVLMHVNDDCKKNMWGPWELPKDDRQTAIRHR